MNREHQQRVRGNIKSLSKDLKLQKESIDWIRKTAEHDYSYNFTWLGRPIIQYPQDIVAMQEIIWEVKPDLIIETGVAHGGSIILYASIMSLIGKGKVLGIDIDIRAHNRTAIEEHALSDRIELIKGSSTDKKVIEKVESFVGHASKILVVLDSNHTYEHVLAELRLYSKYVSKDSYVVVFDTVIDDMPDDFFPERPWGKGNNPKTAVHQFLHESDDFRLDQDIQSKLLVTVAIDGFLKKI